MKIKNIIRVVALPALLMASAIAFASAKPAEARADATNLGTFVFDEANADSAPTYMYGINWTENEAPAGWDTTAFTPVDENSGTFVNGTRVGTEIKKIGPYTYYIAVPGGDIGTVATVKGTWANANYSFTVEPFTRKCVSNPGKWEYALAEYDKVSLAAANMPNFEDVAINTNDDAAYSYTTDPAGLPQRKGYFGLKNGPGSYAFQFHFKKTVQSGGWFEVRIGGTGPWGTGHYLLFKFSNEWASNGCGYVYEHKGTGDIWAPTTLQSSIEFNTQLTGGEDLLEMGAIKVLGYENKYLVFFKTNDVTCWSAYWDLDAAPRTNKVTLYYGNADAEVTNSLSLNDRYQMSLNTYDSTATVLYFNTGLDILPPVGAWENYFIPVVNDGIKLNGTEVASGHWNYFKKSQSTQLFMALGDLGITNPQQGDLLYIGGDFKMAKDLGDNVYTLYRIYLYDYYFEFNGTAWREVNPVYEAADFAKDLLKLTLPVCSVASEGNHDALADIWSELGSNSYYGKLLSSEVNELVAAEADKDIVVPDTELGIEAMDPTDAIKAAMYRYDFCTAKYNLTPFISGRVSGLAVNNRVSFGNNTNSNTLIIVIAVTAMSSLCLAGIILFRKKRVR